MPEKIKRNPLNVLTLPFLLLLILSLSCLEIDYVTQPKFASPGEAFTVTVAIHSEETDPNPHAVFFTIRVPDSWQVLDVAYQSAKFGDGTFQPSPYWADSTEVVHPSPAGYHWQGFLTAESFLADAEKIDATLTCRILPGAETGTFALDYTLGEDALGFDTNWGDVYDFSFGNQITVIRQLKVPDQFATIQAAIDAAQPGMQILVSPGTYRENLQFRPGIRLEGTAAADVIVEGRAVAADSVTLTQLTLQNAGTENSLLTIRHENVIAENCRFNLNAGETGIRCDSCRALQISENVFQGNQATAVLGIAAQLNFEQNQIQSAENGLHLRNSQVWISHNVITNCTNEAVRLSATSGDFCNNTLAQNKNSLVLENSPANIFNNILVSGTGTGISAVGSSALRFNNVWNHTGGNYVNCAAGTGSISADPLFVGGTPFSFELTANSPCIDAGDPESPTDPDGTIADLGTFYFQQPGIPSTIQKIFLVQFTHLDIGFTDPQDVVANGYKSIIDQALSYAETIPNFIWNIESIWQLEEWLSRSTPADVARLESLIQAGKIDICAGYANMHTAVLGTEELNRFLYPAEKFRQRFGLLINTLLQNDVPGYAWAMPSVLADAGVKYFATGINDAHGGAARLPKEHNPFYWQGPDGKKVLTWINYGSYIEWWTKFHLYDLNQFFPALKDELANYEAAGYPYDAIMIMAGSLENRPATTLFSDRVNEWNQKYTNPKLILARADEFFKYLEEKYGTQFATYSGDWAGAWDIISLNVPQSMTLARTTHDRMNTAEKLAGINQLANQAYPAQEFNQIYRNLLQFDEHSGGGTPWPETMTPAETQTQSEIAFNYAKNAADTTNLILAANLSNLSHRILAQGPGVLVFNPLSWQRDDIARVRPEGTWQSQEIEVIDAATGQPVPHQWLADGELTFFAPAVPSVGYKLFYLQHATRIEKQAPNSPEAANQIENQFFRISVNPTDGTILNIFDKQNQRELVNISSSLQFNGIIKATSIQAYTGEHSPVSLTATTVDPPISGDVADILVIRRFASPFVHSEIRLYHQMPRIEIVNISDRAQMDFVPQATNFEYYAYTFPFDIPGFEAHLEGGMSFWNPATDHLPQAPRGAFAIQHGACLSNGAFSLDWANPEAFVVEFERIHALESTFSPAQATLISRFIKKEDEGKFADGSIGLIDAEPGASSLIEMHYAFQTTPADFSPTRTARFGWAFSNPLETLYFANRTTGTLPDSGLSFFKIDQPNVFLVNVKKAERNSDLVLRLLEWDGQPTPVTLSSDYFIMQSASLANAVEQEQQSLSTAAGVQLQIGPHEMRTVLANLSGTSVQNGRAEIPENQFRLEQNYPNPFNPMTTIRYHLPEKSRVRLTIFNLQGQQIRELIHEVQPGGTHTQVWHGDNDQGVPVASGLYFYQLRTDTRILQRKLLFLK